MRFFNHLQISVIPISQNFYLYV